MNTIISEKKTKNKKSFPLAELRTFLLVWVGQVVSILGSGMTGFALGVWIYQETGSAVGFALTLLFNMLPKALVSPLAGVLADRYDRRIIMILADLAAGITTLLVAVLFILGELSVIHIYILTAINASSSALQGPAFGASISQLVPKDQFGRANGMLQLGEGIGKVIAPALAGALIGALGLPSVLLFDMATFLFAVTVMLFVQFPKVQSREAENQQTDSNWIDEIKQAVRYLWERKGLFWLVAVFSLVNFFVGVAEAVLTPMVLSFTTPQKLGGILTIGGVGLLSGSLLVTVWGGGKRKVFAIFGAYAFLSVGVLLAGLRPSVTFVSVAVFTAFFFLPTVMSASQAIMQAKIAVEIQGRVFGLRSFINMISFAAAYLLGGLAADVFFEPLMVDGGLLADVFGGLIGVGPGRGMGLMFVLMGVLSILTALSAFAYPRIRRVEIELPDKVES